MTLQGSPISHATLPGSLGDAVRAWRLLRGNEATATAGTLLARTLGLAIAALLALTAVFLVVALWLVLAPPAGAASAPGLLRDIGPGCPIPFPLFPADNPWNTPVDTLPVDPNSADYSASIGLCTGLHADFGTVWDGAPIGIPYVVRARHPAEGAGHVRLRRRERPGALPDPAATRPSRAAAPAPATATC